MLRQKMSRITHLPTVPAGFCEGELKVRLYPVCCEVILYRWEQRRLLRSRSEKDASQRTTEAESWARLILSTASGARRWLRLARRLRFRHRKRDGISLSLAINIAR